MKLAIISDTHWGVRQDNISILDYQRHFLDEVFFPTLEAENIDRVIHLGDLVDRRKFVNFNSVHRMRVDFLDKLWNKRVHIIPGNHDVYYKNSIQINALDELLRGYKNIDIITEPQVIGFQKTDYENFNVLFVPWICEENHQQCMTAIEDSDAQACFGHFELNGFEMHKGVFCDHGHDKKLFNKFDLVCSGHFHHKSNYKNINYLGSPWQTSWADYNDTKGFHILDTLTMELKFVENPFQLFKKIKYHDAGKSYDEVFNVDFESYRHSYVKLIIQEKSNPFWFDQFVTKLEDANTLDVQVVEDHLNLNLELESDMINEAESTIDILNKSFKNSGIKPELEVKLETLLRTLYAEANLLQA